MNNDIIRQLLGIIGMSFHGEYNAATTYKRGYVVVYEGSSYVAKTTTVGNLPTNTNFFQLVAHKPVYGIDYFTDEEKRNLVQEVLNGVEDELSDVALSGSYNDLLDKPVLSTVATSGSYNDLNNKPDLTIYATNQNLNSEITNRQNSDTNLQNQIDAITVSSDVVDIVGTYQNLQSYDTTKLTNDDIVKVLEDSTHNNALSYYRWHKTSSIGSWVYVGSEGPFYTKGETDTLLNSKQNTIDSSNKIISDNVDDSSSTNKFVTSNDKSNWNGKYTKPSNGIPKTDLVESVRSSLDKADSALQDDDLTDYVKNTDYATSSVGGVIKVSTFRGLQISSGNLQALIKTYEQYNDTTQTSDNAIIGKGTLENVITGKGLVSNADYATNSVGGVIKVGSNAFSLNPNNYPQADIRLYEHYVTAGNNIFVGKGTLENVITGKGLTTKTYVDNLVGDIGTILDNINGEVIGG